MFLSHQLVLNWSKRCPITNQTREWPILALSIQISATEALKKEIGFESNLVLNLLDQGRF
jgi:hypothetical protein